MDMRLSPGIIFILICLIAVNLAYADENQEFISPLGAVIRSSFLPGYGQIYIGEKTHGAFSLITTCSALTGSLIAWSSYKEVYDNEYMPAAKINLYSPQTRKYYNKANQRYKLSQFLLFAGLGFWTYSLIDSYVGANFHNAELKAHDLLKKIEPVENTEFKIGMTVRRFNLKLERKF